LPSLQDYRPPVENNNAGQNIGTNPAPATDLPMKWYKFVIYFQLFLSAVLNFFSGLGNIGNGMDYNDTKMIFYGLCVIGLGVFALVVRSGLKNFKANAPKQYYFLLFGGVILNVLFGYTYPIANFVGTIIGTGIVVACNVVYFNKRKQLFVN